MRGEAGLTNRVSWCRGGVTGSKERKGRAVVARWNLDVVVDVTHQSRCTVKITSPV